MLNVGSITEQTREMLAKAILSGTKDGSLKKAITTGTGLTGINLQAPAMQLVPLMSPLRQMIPRVVRAGATASQYKRITSLSSPKPTTTESAAGATFSTVVDNPSVTYRVLGVQGQVTREAVAASEGFDPALAKETANALLLYMKLEEQYILGGNRTALTDPAAPTVAGVSTGGSIGAGTYTVRIFALTLPAANRVTIRRPADWDGTDANIAAYAITASPNTIDGLTSSDGVESGSAEASTGALSGSTNRIRISWAPVAGAAAYAVSVGLATGITNGSFQVITTQTAITLTSYIALGTNVPGATISSSADANSYDGIIPQLLAGGSGSYLKTLTAKLSGSSTTGEITEIADACQNIWDNARVGRLRVLCGGQEARALTARGVASNSLNIITNPIEAGRASITFGAHVGQIINPVTGDLMPVDVMPWMPGGTVVLVPTEIPYPDANLSSPFDMAMGYDTERWDYASTTSTGPVYPFEVRSYGALRVIFSGGCGMITDIYKG